MKCKQHEQEAIAVCCNCGVALCQNCSITSETGKHCCSSECINGVNLIEQVAALTLDRATKGAKASAYGCYLVAFIFIGFAIATYSSDGFNFFIL